MNTLAFLLPDADLTRQRALCYSFLSALKHSPDPDAIRWVVVSPKDVRRDDLPADHVILPQSDTPRITALQAVCADATGKVCLIDTATDFRADPARLFDRIDADHALLHGADGVMGGADGSKAIDVDTVSGEDVPSRAPRFSPAVIGLDPSGFTLIPDMLALSGQLHVSNAEYLAISTALSRTLQIETCEDLIVRHTGHRRHVYHGRLQHLFPDGRVADARAMANALPRITAPPQPLALKIRARAYGLTHRLNKPERAAYLAYLCSLSAPTQDGRSVWANITLDMILENGTGIDRSARIFTAFAPDGLAGTGLPPDTQARWSDYWASTSR